MFFHYFQPLNFIWGKFKAYSHLKRIVALLDYHFLCLMWTNFSTFRSSGRIIFLKDIYLSYYYLIIFKSIFIQFTCASNVIIMLQFQSLLLFLSVWYLGALGNKPHVIYGWPKCVVSMRPNRCLGTVNALSQRWQISVGTKTKNSKIFLFLFVSPRNFYRKFFL